MWDLVVNLLQVHMKDYPNDVAASICKAIPLVCNLILTSRMPSIVGEQEQASYFNRALSGE